MTNSMDPDPTREFYFKGVRWRARRQLAVLAGTLPKGVQPPPLPEAGIWFISETGEHRFLRMSFPDPLLSQKEFAELIDDELVQLAERAAPTKRGDS